MIAPADAACSVSATAAAIAAVPGLARRLLADHVDDGSGRCQRCAIGAQAGKERWPCRIQTYARAAATVDRTG